MHIRKYNKEDKPKLLEIFDFNVPKYFAPHEAKLFSDYLDTKVEDYLVITDQEEIVGSVGYHFMDDPNKAVIAWIFFNPKFQRKGYGRFAVKHCLKLIRSNDSIRIIEVRTSQYGNKFFESFGFNLKLYKEDYWAKGLDLYHMEMRVEDISDASK